VTPIQVLIFIAIAAVLLISLALILSASSKAKNMVIIHSSLVNIFGENSVRTIKGKTYHYEVETESKVYLIKVSQFNPKHELIITNQYYWCVNENIKNWKRSSAPDLISGVRDFVDLKIDLEKPVVKVSLIYPDCHNITRYLNESDVELVTYKKSAYGVFFIRYSEIELFFKN